ncbi:MAG: hypothetical protein IJ093_01940 [Bacilli bacterium]|nr:hypothetical protein [Bacilli bacterium]
MNLESTPYITIRRANGLNYIDYTQCDILGLNDDSSTAAARSYNTIIGVFTRDSTGEKIYLETSGVYSTTTTSKHKPRAAAIATYNNYKIVPEVRPDVLHDLYFYNKYAADEIIKEAQERAAILEELKNQDINGASIKHAKYTGTIKASRNPETTTYKNGNQLVKYYYQTNFKYCSNIYYEVNQKATPYQVQTRTGPAVTNKYKNTIVNIRS